MNGHRFCVLSTISLLFLPLQVMGETLNEVLDASMRASASTKINQSQASIYDARADQAGAIMMPQLKAIGSRSIQDVSQAQKLAADGTALRVNLTQPLMGLFKNQSAVAAVRDMATAFAASASDSELQLKLSIVDAYHAILTAISDREGYNESMTGATNRANATASRVKTGRSRASDLYAARAQMASAEALYEQSIAMESHARSNLAIISGLSATIPVVHSVVLPGALDALEIWLDGIENHPGVKYIAAQKAAAAMQVQAARRQRLPDLDFVSNYYLRRDAPYDKVRWDVGLQMTMPIYDGGLVTGKVTEVASQAEIYDVQLADKRRALALKIRQSYELCASSMRQLPALKEALSMSQKSFEAIDRDYKLGLATILEQIQAANAVADAKRQLNRQLMSAKANYAALKLNTGRAL